jgi:SAM-dependent methyltransferase
MGIHRVAAEGFGSAAETYEAARPGYPPEVVDWLIENLNVRPASRLIDLAAGTGKLTRLLRARRVNPIAVEPVESMRRVLRQAEPPIPIVAATAEATPFRPASIDAVSIAQAFHWFDNPSSHAELARVVRPGGRLGLIWNARDRTVEWVDRVWSVMDRVEKHAPWRDHESARSSNEWSLPGFTPFHRAEFFHDQRLTRHQVIQRFASVSHVAVLEPEQRQEVLNEVSGILDGHPETKGRTEFTIRYRVDCFWAERLSATRPR